MQSRFENALDLRFANGPTLGGKENRGAAARPVRQLGSSRRVRHRGCSGGVSRACEITLGVLLGEKHAWSWRRPYGNRGKTSCLPCNQRCVNIARNERGAVPPDARART
ncbi:hypothetical protein AAFF_G00105480 [Aldrovandia affinis]|uniref:Uncharacterized protein n=1 Tax=Aldrovandia affinis TaxID=143900 RepID=A0AAD7T251_9TELE|nr:hypothetical protein AAFF_G00105480 [Aldrovandia affinis]